MKKLVVCGDSFAKGIGCRNLETEPYGSLVAKGREFHDTLNQSLASDAVHEVVIGETKTW